jgi:hypothetical protein
MTRLGAAASMLAFALLTAAAGLPRAAAQDGNVERAGSGRSGGNLSDPLIVPDVPDAPAPRLPDGTPDLGGLWVGGGPTRDIEQGLLSGEEIMLLPEAAEIMAGRLSRDDPEVNCLPTGVPRIAPYPWRIVQVPAYGRATHLYFLFEGNIHSYRQIFMDGREHPEDLDPTWYGHSIGHWEGDTLVVDTIGFNERFWMDREGMPHTEELHFIERFTRTSDTMMTYEVTVDDPGAYTEPWSGGFYLRWSPGEELFEYVCQDNNYAAELMIGLETAVDQPSPIVP